MPSTNSCSGWRSKRRGASRTWPPYCHSCSMSVAEAMEAGFPPALDEDQADMFTPSELRLYRHAQDHRLLTRDILGYPSLFGDILG